ncbi:aldose 1-epimerase [Sphingobium naphthae]|uniref:Aldose 1-epimerase n=1 Tax=Sphingobium naphthae TaxID=1886786 RepID=A0ABU3ZT95_9SPHN|nr:aldose 1-epimerase [Sphingobium naphthae]MDV5822703.1 aldose 1-epimerase [Sphingobium naphthae]
MRAGALEAALSPAIGGSMTALMLDGVDLLRRAPDGADDPLAMASFPLVPYANRIAQGRFAFDGADHQLPRNFGDHPHSIHGFGWQASWTAKATGADHVLLVHDHPGNTGWPWPYHAEQQVMLRPAQLSVSLSLLNVGDRPMPAGLGFHPYFVADAGTRLCFAAGSLWLSTPDMLPQREAPADTLGDWSRPAPVQGTSLIDNVYGGWHGSAIVERSDGLRLTLTATGADWLHVYRPPGSDHFCLEPVSHMPDAINRGGMAVLQPGETARLAMTIAIDKSDQALPKSGGIA